MPPKVITNRLAAAMRRALTLPEATLWLQLKGRSLEGWKFRRQHPVGPYILDSTAQPRGWRWKWMERGMIIRINWLMTSDALNGWPQGIFECFGCKRST